MYKIIFIVAIGCVGVTNGFPLEDPNTDLSRYFSRIVGGEVAPENFAPYAVALLAGDHVVMLTCGGSLMTPNLVLTAAHCIEIFVIWGNLLPSFHALVGSNDWNKGGTVANFSGFDVHPDYDYRHVKYDVGFLMLKDKVELSETVTTIALNYDLIGGQEECFVAGWGRLGNWGIIPYKLQLLRVKTISPEACAEGIRKGEMQWGVSVKLQPDIEICTFHSKGHGMCNGDSGSALVQIASGKQIGITSWGFPCAMGFPDVFVRVSGIKNYTETFIKEYQ